MKIEDDELIELSTELSRSLHYEKALKLYTLITILQEAQELIEKFAPRTQLDSYGRFRCVYCGSWDIDIDDCPYAIRERLGYGQKETKDG